MIIEVIGPSGSGKSTYVDFHNPSKGFISVSFFDYFNLSFISFFYISLRINFRQTFSLKNLSFGIRFRLFYRKFIYAIAYYRKSLMIRKNKDKSYDLYIDEGVFQHFISLVEHSSDIEKEFKKYFTFVNKSIVPDKLVIFIPNSSDLIKENMQLRQRFPRKDFGKEYFDNFLEVQVKVVGALPVLFKKYSKNILKKKMIVETINFEKSFDNFNDKS